MEQATVFGLLLGIGGIILGNFFEGGEVRSLGQFAALIIVLCGTFGATLVANKVETVKLAFQLFLRAFKKTENEDRALVNDILDCARFTQKETLLALEPKLGTFKNAFLRSVLRSVIDGVDTTTLQDVYKKQIHYDEEKLTAAAHVWMDAGGYSPTIGIIGAVLGLIHVMGNLTDTSKLGAGIATAFVATIYGVGFANLIFLPIGTKLRKLIQHEMRLREMILEGGISIQQGLPSSLIQIKLKSFLEGQDTQLKR